MKKLLFLTPGFLVAAGLSLAAEVDVDWGNPDSWSDIGTWGQVDRSTLDGFQETISERLEKLADRYLADGQDLKVEFHDVDLAGETEPWHRTGAQDIRVVRSIYPPRLKFHYVVKDRTGETLTEGMSQLSDTTFLWTSRPNLHDDERFYYETELLEDWARKTLRPLGDDS